MTKLKPRTTTVTLFQGDDFDRERELRGAVENAVMSDSGSRRMNDPDAVLTAANDYDAFVVEAAERGVTLPLAMVPRSAWREMVAEHPPRPDNEEDAEWGFNYFTLADDLVDPSVAAGQEVPAEVFEGKNVHRFDSIADRDEFLESLSDADFTKIYHAAIGLNQNGGPDPKVRLSSRLGLTSAETSTQPTRLV